MIKRYHKKDRAAINAAYNDKMRDTLQNIESVIGTGVALKNRAEFHMNLGIAYGIMQEHDSALMAYNRALELDKKIAVLWAYRGFTHHLRGEKKKAHDDYREALKLNRKTNLRNITWKMIRKRKNEQASTNRHPQLHFTNTPIFLLNFIHSLL
jgi:tetratricopeptide (TPR) repeat protein